MPYRLDAEAVDALLTLPRSDGLFAPDHASYLRSLGQRRQSVMLAFAPKAAGTFLRTATIYAVDGQLARVVHAQGGRDATPYLPIYLMYLAENLPAKTLVTHVHMQAFPANRHLIEALDLRPVIMLRSVPDMLVSYLDMLEQEPLSSVHWLNAAIPPGFLAWDYAARADFVIDIIAPWYASYYATWLDYVREAPGRVCVQRYADVVDDTASVVEAIAAHSRIVRPFEQCERAVAMAQRERKLLRFNKGEQGRGNRFLDEKQRARIARLLFDLYDLEEWRADLMPA